VLSPLISPENFDHSSGAIKWGGGETIDKRSRSNNNNPFGSISIRPSSISNGLGPISSKKLDREGDRGTILNYYGLHNYEYDNHLYKQIVG